MAIRVLPPEVAARIAAGEVVERPASVVKELIENALDAGASRISVEVQGGGIDSIRVSDDGCGIAPEELELAFQRHATSKLDDGHDLSRILTLGFRGEALPAIAAVAEVELVSRPPGAQAAAYLRLAPQSPPQRGGRGGPVGTSVSVRRLFARLPARRKFLRSPASETNAIANVVTHYALAYPEVRVSLTLDGRQPLLTAGSGDRRDAVAAVYGPDLAAAMLPVRSGERNDGDPGLPANTGLISVAGLVAPPHISRAGRGYVSLFVNRRWVQSRRLVFAVEEAYQGLLMVGRHPVAVLDLRLPHEDVDVNVHPGKAEVRFRDESAVFAAVQRAVRRALLEAAPVPAPSSAAAAAPLFSPQPTTPPLWQHAVALESRAAHPGQRTADPGQRPVTPAQALPVLRVIGQFGGLYIVAEGPDGPSTGLRTGMYLIDQHAAHERVLYERFCRLRAERAPEVQGLLEPLALELPPRHVALLAEQAGALRDHGFDIEPFGDGAYLLRSLPRALAEADVRQAVLQFLDLMAEEEEDDPSTGSLAGQAGRDRVAMTLACHGAVRAGKTLALDEMRELVRQLEGCETPHTCPHGRPTMLHMSADLLARQFGRR